MRYICYKWWVSLSPEFYARLIQLFLCSFELFLSFKYIFNAIVFVFLLLISFHFFFPFHSRYLKSEDNEWMKLIKIPGLTPFYNLFWFWIGYFIDDLRVKSYWWTLLRIDISFSSIKSIYNSKIDRHFNIYR